MSMLSVVIPSYNEQENIARTAAALAEILKRTDMDYELLFVDDGSKDETYAASAQMQAEVSSLEASSTNSRS